MSEFGNETSGKELPENVAVFINLNKQTIVESSEIRNAQLRQLIDEGASIEDHEAAEQLLEEEAISISEERIWESAEKGIITFWPPHADKGPMIILMTKDPDVYSIFNKAASKALKDFRGFQQIGANEDRGVCGWELWDPQNRKSYEYVEMVFKEAEKLTSL